MVNRRLQFGHGPLAVDHSHSGRPALRQAASFNSATARWPWITPNCRTPRLHWTGFNSATARWPWITTPATTRERSCFRLQFGHGPLAVDHPGRAPAAGREIHASIRPRPAGRGSRGAEGSHREGVGRFNSATARWPWITPTPVASVSLGSQLQFGHGPLAVDHPHLWPRG